MMHGSWSGDSFGSGSNYMGGGLMILILVLIIGLVVFAVYWAAKRGGTNLLGDKQEDPFQILKARYAKGEISKEEYHTMKAEIE